MTRVWIQRLLVWGAFILIWEAIGIIVGPFFWPRFSAILVEIASFVQNGDVWVIASSFRQLIVGFSIATIIGVPLGLLMGSSSVVEAIFAPYFKALLVLPLEAFLPLLIILFGTQFVFRIAVVFLFSFYYIVINTAAGIRAINPMLIEMAKSFNAPYHKTFWHIFLPATFPYALTGLRLGLGNAFKGMILAELWVAVDTGRLLIDLSAERRLAELFAVAFVIIGMGALCIWLLEQLQNYTLHWERGDAKSTLSERLSPSKITLHRWITVFSICFGLLCWQWYGSQPTTFAIAPLTKVSPALWNLVQSRDFWIALAGTLSTMFVGYLAAVLIGVLLGILITFWSWAKNTIEPIINILNVAPITLFIPILSAFLGFGIESRILLVMLWVIFVIIFNTTMGFRTVPTQLLEVGHAYHANRFQLIFFIMLPSALPNILTGLRIGIGRALRGAIAAEMLLSVSNLGKLIKNASGLFQIPKLMAGIVVILMIGLVIMQMAIYLEAYLLNRKQG